MPQPNCDHTLANGHPKRPPRRMKSFSDALDLIGTSFHNIYDKHAQKKKSKTISQSTANLPQAVADSEPAPKINHRSKSLKTRRSTSSEKEVESPDDSISSVPHSSPQQIIQNGYHSETNMYPKPARSNYEAQKKASAPQAQNETDSVAKSSMKAQTFPSNSNLLSSGVPKPSDTRRASIRFVDFLTEDGIQNNTETDETETEEEEDEDELRDEPGIMPDSSRSKTWFPLAFEPTSEQEEDEFEEEDVVREDTPPKPGKHSINGDFDNPSSNFYRRMRKDSIAISLKSARSMRSMRATPEPDGGPTQRRNVDDLIFDMFREKDEEVAVVGTFLAALSKTGLRKDDPRLAELFENLARFHKEQEAELPGRIGSIETLRLDRESFKIVITDNIVLISKAFRQQFVIPEFQTFCGHIEEMFWKCRDVKGGKVAGYIPQLARVDPNLWGVSVCTVDGQRYSIGDTMIPFTIQSCSKPLTYAIALNELGEDTVHQYVGQEPSGRMFNELVLDHNKKPHNPMVNAGAIIMCSLLKSMVRPEMSLAEKFDYTHAYFKKLCGGEYVGFNNAVFLSERDAADRNYALGFYMRENKCFPEGTNLKECMDYYFQICSMECNCEAMSVMAATLANGGICPVSGEKVLKSDSVRDVLSLMHSCGMYDYSGQFAFKVGLPAKSGVSGAIMLVVPNVLGMAVWSPPLDVLGNTVKGVALCQELVSVFNFHKYDNLKHASDKLDPRRHRYETKGLNIVNLLFSAASGDVTSMRRHHLSGMDMNASDYDGRTALHLAAAEGHLECVEYLLRHCHVSFQPIDRWGHLPVDDAKKFEHEDVFEFLKKWAIDNPE